MNCNPDDLHHRKYLSLIHNYRCICRTTASVWYILDQPRMVHASSTVAFLLVFFWSNLRTKSRASLSLTVVKTGQSVASLSSIQTYASSWFFHWTNLVRHLLPSSCMLQQAVEVIGWMNLGFDNQLTWIQIRCLMPHPLYALYLWK